MTYRLRFPGTIRIVIQGPFQFEKSYRKVRVPLVPLSPEWLCLRFLVIRAPDSGWIIRRKSSDSLTRASKEDFCLFAESLSRCSSLNKQDQYTTPYPP